MAAPRDQTPASAKKSTPRAARKKAATSPTLRAVAADEKAEPEEPREFRSIAEAAAGGTARDLLVATRNRIARTLDEPNCPARDQASLSRRLLEIRKEIEAIDAAAQQEAEENGEAEDAPFDASAI